MKHNKPPVFLIILIGFAAVGLGVSLVRNPGSFLIQILIMILIAFVLFKVVSYFMQKQSGENSDEMKKYKQAAKKSNERFGKTPSNIQVKQSKKSNPKKKKKRRRHAPHLTVIEGKKSNKDKNDRASN